MVGPLAATTASAGASLPASEAKAALICLSARTFAWLTHPAMARYSVCEHQLYIVISVHISSFQCQSVVLVKRYLTRDHLHSQKEKHIILGQPGRCCC